MERRALQSNTEVYSSFASIYTNPVICSCVVNIGLGSVR